MGRGKGDQYHREEHVEMVEVRREDFSVTEIVAKMKNPKIGAIVIYLGVVREFPQGSGLEFEDRKEITQKLQQVEDRAIHRFDVEDSNNTSCWVVKHIRQYSTNSSFSTSQTGGF